MSMYCGGHGHQLPCPECAQNLQRRLAREAAERKGFELYFSAAWLQRDGDTYKDVHADLWEGWRARGEWDGTTEAGTDLPHGASEPDSNGTSLL